MADPVATDVDRLTPTQARPPAEETLVQRPPDGPPRPLPAALEEFLEWYGQPFST